MLIINGRNSDILTPEIIKQMQSRGPKFEHVIIEDAGHAPALMAKQQIDIVKNWIVNNSSLNLR